jgi:TrmH family RNA methyltransferase
MTELISSHQNPKVKYLATLRRRRRRGNDDQILIDGTREIGRAKQAGLALDELYFCQALLDPEVTPEGLAEFEAAGAHLVEVTEPVFEKTRYGDRTGGLVAVAQRPRRTLGDLKLSANPLVAVIERVGKPGNVGGIVRSADGAGIEAVLVADSAIDIYGPNAIRASIGTIFSVPAVELTAADALTFLRKAGLQIVSATPGGSTLYTDLDFRRPTAFVFGSEDQGLSPAWAAPDIVTAKVPMRGIADSLNVATTAALFFYEALRQRGCKDE